MASYDGAVLRVRFSECVGTAALQAMHQGRIPQRDGNVATLLHDADIASVTPVYDVSESEIELGLAAARDFELAPAIGADEAHAGQVLRDSSLVQELTLETEAAIGVAHPPEPLTPGRPVAAVPYAGFWVRFAAWILDSLILGFGLGFATIVIAGISQGSFTAVVSFLIIVPVIVVAYSAGFEGSGLQATPGKMAVGVQVTDTRGDRLSPPRALWRGAVKGGLLSAGGPVVFVFPLTAFLPFTDALVLVANDKKQALHDMFAGTLVVHRQR
jgi:uncharacterized RDD family membrane protein YckC